MHKLQSVQWYATTSETDIDKMMTKDTLSKQVKGWINEDPENELLQQIDLGARKATVVSQVKIYATTTHNDAERNDAVSNFTDAVEIFSRSRTDPAGEFLIGSSKARILLHGREVARSKREVIKCLPDDMKTEKTDRSGEPVEYDGKPQLVPKPEVWLSHAILLATEVKGEATATGNAMTLAMLESGNLELDAASARVMLDNLETDSPNKETGLLSRAIVQSLIDDLHSIMPEGYTDIGFIAPNDDSEFSSCIIYDVTERGTHGMFKTPNTLPRKLKRTPHASELLSQSFNSYMTRKETKWAEILAFRVIALSRFNLIRLALPFKEDVLPKTGNLKDLQIDHGISRNNSMLKILGLAEDDNFDFFPFDTARNLLRQELAALSETGFTVRIHRSKFIRGSKANKAASAEKDNSSILTPEFVGDIHAGPSLIETFLDVCCSQGQAESIMNMLASENRVGSQTGGMPNIGYLLRQANKPDASGTDKRMIGALNLLQTYGIFRPWGWQNGVLGKSDGVKTQGQMTNMDGRYSRNDSHIRPVVKPLGGVMTIGLEALPLSEASIAKRDADQKPRKPKHKKAKKQPPAKGKQTKAKRR